MEATRTKTYVRTQELYKEKKGLTGRQTCSGEEEEEDREALESVLVGPLDAVEHLHNKTDTRALWILAASFKAESLLTIFLWRIAIFSVQFVLKSAKKGAIRWKISTTSQRS